MKDKKIPYLVEILVSQKLVDWLEHFQESALVEMLVKFAYDHAKAGKTPEEVVELLKNHQRNRVIRRDQVSG